MRNYRVNLDDDALEPEESLLEAVSPDSRIERPIKSGFFVVFYFGILLIFSVFTASGLNLGIVKRDYYAGLSAKNQYISVPVFPQRGLIYSKEGVLLAANKETFSLWFIPSKLKEGSEADSSRTIASGELRDKSNRYGAGPERSREGPSRTNEFVRDPQRASASYGAGEKEGAVLKLSEALDLPFDSVSETIQNNMNKASFLIKEGLTKEEKEKILSLGLPFLILAENSIRIYPGAEVFSHLIGYVSSVNEEDLKKDGFYKFNDEIGRDGLESFYEEILRGRRGEILIHRFNDESRFKEPEEGNGLVLNIDSELQRVLYRELAGALRETGSKSGVAVALDPRDGRVLSLISLPSYDNNSFIGGLKPEEYKLFLENKMEPLLNRVISGRFAPGSTIKPIIALAALEENVINPSKKINAPGFITIVSPYNPDVIYTFRDWRNHGWVNMKEAIAYSSDIYFYTVGGGFYDIEGLGIERIAKYLKTFKLDSILGVDLKGEATGFVPSPEWKRERRNEIWYQGDTFNVSIGQGDLLVTPLWLTSYIGAIGNGSVLYRPFIADKVLDQKGGITRVFHPQVFQEFSFNEENLKVVREGMKMAAKVGTAKVLADLPFEVGAKSGTAEVIKGQSTNSWISVFAPYDNPQIVLTVMLESGREGSYIPHQIAYRILKEYFK